MRRMTAGRVTIGRPRLGPCRARVSAWRSFTQTAGDHGGSVCVANADDGGVLVTLRFAPGNGGT
jgi:hypothetical protein